MTFKCVTAYVYLASLIGDLAMLRKPNQASNLETKIVQWLIRGIGLLATITVTVYLAHLTEKALNTTL
ncbi:hypothetical protein ACE1B6_23500 [Aerosakkonemataceae cyanobacterium BLCC-F154]|uniref:DUF1146 domain-containing protein n=1 Tax=Floridaenema fluviatile BLCC-F154 TaxID=3153640 RepID=A0ABV4YHC4_9CYAN